MSSRGLNSKCLALTLKAPNSKRTTEEISRCTRFALPARNISSEVQMNQGTPDTVKDSPTIINMMCKRKIVTIMPSKIHETRDGFL